MKQELTNAFGNVYLTIEVDLLNHWVYNNWIGYLTEECVKAGAEAFTQVVKEAGLSCVLNDNREVLGRWDHSIDWALQEWVPMAASAGIKYFAIIAQPDSLTASSAATLIPGVHFFEMRAFDDKAEAENWLRPHCLSPNL
jgi:hypothetical protein